MVEVDGNVECYDVSHQLDVAIYVFSAFGGVLALVGLGFVVACVYLRFQREKSESAPAATASRDVALA
jgi:hypothetical protein